MKSFIFTDTDGARYRVWPRGSYQHFAREYYFSGQQRAADEQRAKGREALAQSIEAKTFIAWCADSGWAAKYQLLTKRARPLPMDGTDNHKFGEE